MATAKNVEREPTISQPGAAKEGIAGRGASAMRLAQKVLLVGFVCHFSTEIGFALKFPPHYISPLWPTGAILFSVLVPTPVRQWWAYTLAAYFTSVINDARVGFPVSAILFVIAGLIEILVAAVGVRRFAGGLRAFDSLRSVVAYIIVAVVLAPFISAFVAAFAGGIEKYWFYWRVWFLSEALAYLMLAPALLTGIASARSAFKMISLPRWIEACLIGFGLLAISVRIFSWPAIGESSVPALVYLPLPFLIWAAVRFGPTGVNTSLLVVASVSISGAVRGLGPFVASTPDDSVLPLQLFLLTMSMPLMLLATSIRERQDKEKAQLESEARFRTIANAAPVMIWMSGPDRLCMFFNKGWLDFTGRSIEQELGNGWTEGIHPNDFNHCVESYVNAFNARQDFKMEYRLRRFDGAYGWVLDHGVPHFDSDGAFLGYIGVAIDVTERKRTELQLQRQRDELAHVTRLSTMGELTASVAHELNQPLGAILSNAEAAEMFLDAEPPAIDEVREILADIRKDDELAGEIILRMRNLLRKQEVVFSPIDINAVVEESFRLVGIEAAARRVAVRFERMEDLPRVAGDRIHLQQVLMNLIINALEAMAVLPIYQRELIVRTGNQNGMVKVAVSDGGPGIADEKLAQLFEPFFTTKEGGMGMGLCIARTIMEAHHGHIWAENNPGGGATFSFTVPVFHED